MVVPVYEARRRASTTPRRSRRGSTSRKCGSTISAHLGLLGKVFLQARQLRYPVFKTRYARVRVYICYDRHFPEGAAAQIERRGDRVQSVGHRRRLSYICSSGSPRTPWRTAISWRAAIASGPRRREHQAHGSSYFVDPRGNFLTVASEDKTELITAEMDLDMIEEVRRVWQFYRDRRPETYGGLTEI